MSNYGNFAKFYDTVMGDRSNVTQKVVKYIQERHPGANTVLELACGTGANIKALSDKYDIAGLELSKEMLEIACKKNPGVKFYHQDMRNFQIDQKFDVILCLFDSINHLTSFDDWTRVFKGVAKHLNTEGIFIFDINTEERLEKLSSMPPQVREFDGNYLIMNVVKEGLLSNWEVKIFEQKSPSDYKFHKEIISEVSFDKCRIEEKLKTEFKEIYVEVASTLDTGEPGRLYFVCKK